MPRPLRHRGGKGGFHLRKPVARRGADEVGLAEGDALIQALRVDEELALVRDVHLVEDEDLRLLARLQGGEHGLDLLAKARLAVDH
jgi:hypothetical protein